MKAMILLCLLQCSLPTFSIALVPFDCSRPIFANSASETTHERRLTAVRRDWPLLYQVRSLLHAGMYIVFQYLLLLTQSD